MVKSEITANDFNTALTCRLFEGCGEDEVKKFWAASAVSVCDFAGGEEIPLSLRDSHWGIVLCGSVRIFSGGDGGAVLLNVVGRREPFDIASLTGRRSATPQSRVTAAGKCRIAFLTAMELTVLMSDYPRIAANCFVFFTNRIAFLNGRLHTLSCGSAEGKLANYLLSEFTHEGGSCTVRLKSCVELADRLGVSRASLYRALGALEESGVISRAGKVITICDLEALQGT